MGAELWECFTPYNEDLNEAIRSAQEQVFNEGSYFNLGTREEAIEDTEEALRNLENETFLSERTREHLREVYQSQIDELKALPEAKTLEEKINEVRSICMEEGTKSILDMDGVSETPELMMVTPVSVEQLMEIVGSLKPTREMIQEKRNDLVGLCDRLMAISVTVYQDEVPTEIYFAGWSAD